MKVVWMWGAAGSPEEPGSWHCCPTPGSVVKHCSREHQLSTMSSICPQTKHVLERALVGRCEWLGWVSVTLHMFSDCG